MSSKQTHITRSSFVLLILYIYTCLYSPSSKAALPNELEPVPAISLHGTWQVHLSNTAVPVQSLLPPMNSDPSLWNPVSIPGHWQMSAWGQSVASAPYEYYKTKFRLPSRWEKGRVFLRLEGVLGTYKLWVDGKEAGHHDLSMLPAEFDITDRLSEEKDHVLLVRNQTHSPLLQKTGLSGIYRDVIVFLSPETAIDDIQVETKYDRPHSTGYVQVEVALNQAYDPASRTPIELDIQLNSPENRRIAQTTITWFENRESHAWGRANLPITDPQLWTAETPHLYTLTAELRRENQPLHRISLPVGIRQVDTSGGILTCNRTPVTLRGVNYYEYHPDVGFALRKEHWQNDLALMKQANINTIRPTGTPPHPYWLNLCDNEGFYVVYDIPLPAQIRQWDTILQQRVLKNRNHPCIVAWSISGSVTRDATAAKAIEILKRYDATRPVLIAGLADESLANIDILAPQFPDQDQLEDLAKSKKAVLATALVSAVGNAIEGLEEFQDIVYKQPHFAGGLVQQFCDIPLDPPTRQDGIVSIDRTLQWDYRQVKSVYSPIQILEQEKRIVPGKQTIESTLQNRYDFLNLKDIRCEWHLMEDGKSVLKRKPLFNLEAGKQMEIAAQVDLPDDLADHDYSLLYRFFDIHQNEIYTHSVILRPRNWKKNLVARMRDLSWDPAWKVTAGAMRAEVSHKNYAFVIQLATAGWFMRTRAHNVRLITGGPFIRLGHISSSAGPTHNPTESLHPEWIKQFRVEEKRMEKIGKNIELQTRIKEHPASEQAVEAEINILSSPFGYSDIQFSIQPSQWNRGYQDIGLTFVVPRTMNQIAWIGEGPYPGYPGQTALNRWGYFFFRPIQKIVPGNRRRITRFAMRDKGGNGLGIVLLEGQVSFTPTDEGCFVTINQAVAGLGNGVHPTRYPLTRSIIHDLGKTVFRLIPLIRGHYPAVFENL